MFDKEGYVGGTAEKWEPPKGDSGMVRYEVTKEVYPSVGSGASAEINDGEGPELREIKIPVSPKSCDGCELVGTAMCEAVKKLDERVADIEVIVGYGGYKDLPPKKQTRYRFAFKRIIKRAVQTMEGWFEAKIAEETPDVRDSSGE